MLWIVLLALGILRECVTVTYQLGSNGTDVEDSDPSTPRVRIKRLKRRHRQGSARHLLKINSKLLALTVANIN